MPRVVVEVLSPSTRDFDTFEKLIEYKTVASLDHILVVEPNAPEVVHWSRDADRDWEKRSIEGLDQSTALPEIGVTLPLREIYDGVLFPARHRLVNREVEDDGG